MNVICNACRITWVMGEVGPCPLCGGGNTAEDKREGLVQETVNLKSLALTSLTVRAWAQAAKNLDEERGGKTVVARRREQLAKEDESYLAKLYGLKMICPWTPRSRELDISTGHTLSTTYLRDAWDKAATLFNGVIDRMLQQKGGRKKGKSYFLVNSQHIVQRLDYLVNQGQLGTCTIAAGSNGLYVLEATLAENGQSEEGLKEHLANVGATPSSYRAFKYMEYDSAIKKVEPTLDEKLDNVALLTDILQHPLFAKLKQNAASKTGMWSVEDTCARMLEGLKKLFAGNRKFKTAVLVASALRSLYEFIQILAVSHDRPSRLSRYYDLLLEEVFLILAVVAPYKASSWHEHPLVFAEDRIMRDRTPLLEHLGELQSRSMESLSDSQLEKVRYAFRKIHPAWSGMDALVTALEAAAKCSGEEVQLLGKGSQGNYFEIPIVLAAQARIAKDPSKAWILYGTMLPSTPLEEPPNPLDIIREVVERVMARRRLVAEKRLDPKVIKCVTLVVDGTIQVSPKHGRHLDRLLSGLIGLVGQGDLQIFVARSYQKYQQLGSGKFMGGAVTLFHSLRNHLDKQPVVDSAEYLTELQTTDNLERDEIQFFTFVLQYVADSELNMIGQSGENARFAEQELLPWSPNTKGVEGLPFLMKPDDAEKWLQRLDALQLDSFGMVTTTFLGVVGLGLRITMGQESRERLIEKFYAAGHLMPTGDSIPWVIEQLTSILTLQANVGRNEVLPFTVTDAQGKTKLDLQYNPAALISAYKENAPRVGKGALKGTDLDYVVASYLTFVLGATKGGYVQGVTNEIKLIKQFDAPEQLAMLRLFRGFFRRGLLMRVTPEARSVLSAGWLELLYNLKDGVMKKPVKAFLTEYGLQDVSPIPFPVKTRVFLEVFDVMPKLGDVVASTDLLGYEIAEFGRYAPKYFATQLVGTPGGGSPLTAVVKKYLNEVKIPMQVNPVNVSVEQVKKLLAL
ncbi:hypothetical protein P2318_06810 [Myxococcaceae bacterium GXIMD 01537]